MTKEVEKEVMAARASLRALLDTIGRGKTAAERKRITAAEERLQAAQDELDEERAAS